MTSTTWAETLLIVVLLAPLASVVLAVAVAVPAEDRRWTIGGGVVAAVGAIVLLTTGQHPHVSRLAPDDLALAAAAATALLVIAMRPASRTPVVAAALTVLIAGVTAGTPGDPSTVGPLLAIAGVIALVTLTRDAGRLTIAATGAGVVVAAAGIHSGHRGGAAAAVGGAALIAVVASFDARRAVTIVVPAALLLALRAGPQLAGTSTARWLAVALGVAGAGLALAPALFATRVSIARVTALVPWTLLAAAGPLPGMPVAARALAAGAVIALLLGGPLALLAALPGAAISASAIADGGGWPRAVLALLAIATVFGLVTAQRCAVASKPRPVDAIVGIAAAWFVVRPTSWTWTRVQGLQAYSDGTVLAAATALISGVLLAIAGGHVEREPIGAWLLISDEPAATDAGGTDVLLLCIVALMGIAAAALLRSARL